MDQRLPAVLEAGELVLNILFISAILLLFLMEFLEPFRLLTQAFLQLLLFFELGIHAALQLLSPSTASFLLVQPRPRTACNVGQSATGHLNGRFRRTAGVFGRG